MHVYISAITIARVHLARTEPRRARNHLHGIDPARAVPRTGIDTIHDGGKAIQVIQIPAHLDDVCSLNLNVYVKKCCIYTHITITDIIIAYCENLIQLFENHHELRRIYSLIFKCVYMFVVYLLHLLHVYCVSLCFPLRIRPMILFFEVVYLFMTQLN